MHLILASTIQETIDGWIADVSPKQFPRLLFITTAAEVYGDTPWMESDVKLLEEKGYNVECYSITRKTSDDIKKKFAEKDIVFVEGGNTYYLLQELKRHGADRILDAAVRKGMPFIGASAGSVIATKTIEYVGDFDDRAQAPELSSLDAFGWIDLLLFVHWGYEEMDSGGVKTTEIIRSYFMHDEKMIILRDNHYLQVRDDGFYKIVSVS